MTATRAPKKRPKSKSKSKSGSGSGSKSKSGSASTTASKSRSGSQVEVADGRRRSSTRTPRASRPRSSRPSSGDRFQARRLAVERSEGVKRLRVVLGLTLVSSLAIGVIGFLNSSLFDVNDISVVGNQQSDPHLIVEASEIMIGQALLEVDLDNAVERVQLVPWVGTAEITRSWTGSIEITVGERGPSAVLRAGDGYALVDDHGRQLEIVDSRPEGYMPVSGLEGSGVPGEPAPTEALPVIALLEALPPEVESQIAEIVVADGQIFVQLAAGGRANLGDGADLGPKLQSLETMLATVDLTCLDTIDVRVPAAPTLTRSQPSSAEGDSGGATPTEGEPNEESDSGVHDC